MARWHLVESHRELKQRAGHSYTPALARYVTLIAAVEAFRTMGGQSLYDDLAYVKLELDNVAWLQERSSHGEYGALMNLLSGFPFAVGVLSALCKSATSAFQQSSRHRHQRSSALQDCRNKLQSPALFSESMETTRRASNDWLRVLGCASQTSNPIRAPVIGFLAPIPCITDPPCSLQIISHFAE